MPAKTRSPHESGQRLTELRLARGLTELQLASTPGTSQRAISRLERIAEYPTVPLLVGLCDVLHTSADELQGLKPPPKLAAARQPPEEKRLCERHLKVVASLAERDQRPVLSIIDSTAKARRGA